MMSPKTRLVIAASLFLGWLGFLLYLVVRSRDPFPRAAGEEKIDLRVLSRPQFLSADLYVTARLQAVEGKPAAMASIEETLWAGPKAQSLSRGTEIAIQVELPLDGPVKNRLSLQELEFAPLGWLGEGTYLLPLSKSGPDYVLTAIPSSPGYSAPPRERFRIYPVSEEALRQARQLSAEKS